MLWVMLAGIESELLAPFKVQGREVAQAAVAAPGVVPTFNPGEDGHAGLRFGLEAVALDEFGLQALSLIHI